MNCYYWWRCNDISQICDINWELPLGIGIGVVLIMFLIVWLLNFRYEWWYVQLWSKVIKELVTLTFFHRSWKNVFLQIVCCGGRCQKCGQFLKKEKNSSNQPPPQPRGWFSGWFGRQWRNHLLVTTKIFLLLSKKLKISISFHNYHSSPSWL